MAIGSKFNIIGVLGSGNIIADGKDRRWVNGNGEWRQVPVHDVENAVRRLHRYLAGLDEGTAPWTSTIDS